MCGTDYVTDFRHGDIHTYIFSYREARDKSYIPGLENSPLMDDCDVANVAKVAPFCYVS